MNHQWGASFSTVGDLLVLLVGICPRCIIPERFRIGNLNTKIVGVRFYNGYATAGEHVVLKREPSNQYDPNAIRVDNVMGAQVGHIPRGMAAKLAKYMVCSSIDGSHHHCFITD